MSDEYEVIKIEIGKLKLKPGDALVIKFSDEIDTARQVEIFEAIRDWTISYFNVPVMAICEGIEVTKLSNNSTDAIDTDEQ